MLERGKNVGGDSRLLPGSIYQVSLWWESPLASLASRSPPYLQFIWIFSYLGFNSLRVWEGGPHSYSNRVWADVRNLKTNSSLPVANNSPAENNKPLSSSEGKGVGLGGGRMRRQEASLLPSDLHLKTQHLLVFQGPHCGFTCWTPGDFSRQELMVS